MILVDTSAWVEFDRATGSEVHLRVRAGMRRGAAFAVTEPILMEVLAGATSVARTDQLRRLMVSQTMLAVDAASDYEGAAQIYRRCRQVGVTPRGPVGCLIAAVALRHGASILAQDRDLVAVAGVMGIDLDEATPIG